MKLPGLLLIETDEVTLELYRRELSKSFTVFGFTDIHDALREIPRLDIRAAVIEPEVNAGRGWELIHRLQTAVAKPPIPVIVCSTRDKNDSDPGVKVSEFLTKPILPGALRERTLAVIKRGKPEMDRAVNDSPFIPEPRPSTERYDTHVPNAWVQENSYLSVTPEQAPVPSFAEARELLPDPFWSDHDSAIACYWRAWELAFEHLRQPTVTNNFSANYVDSAFNSNLFMWDSAFITCFGGYGRRAFDFQKTLDNFYRKQHPDGFICREISEADGVDCFPRFDPSSTGPNVLAWAEWNSFEKTGDMRRLERVFAPLMAYHQWMRTNRSWPDGSYWSTGWGTGMDNLRRLGAQGHVYWENGHMTWVDATFQAMLSARILLQMANVLGRPEAESDLCKEIELLSAYGNEQLWSDELHFYCDRSADGSLSAVKHIGAYWALLARAVPQNCLDGFVAHLENPAEFRRAHRIPALSADDPHYDPTGDYWSGGVWAPTNYMVLKGLEQNGYHALAHEIAANHLESVVRVFESDFRWAGAEQFRQYFHLTNLQVDDRHTLWENYAPDRIEPGQHSKPGYVGWSGIPPIAVLLENIFGLTANAASSTVIWRVQLLEEHGVGRYPFGASGLLDLKCGPRSSQQDRPQIEIHANVPLTLQVLWEGGKETLTA